MLKVTVMNLPEHMIREPAFTPAAASSGVSAPGGIGRTLWSSLLSLYQGQRIFIVFLAFLLGRVSLLGESVPAGLAFFAAVAHLARPQAALTALGMVAGALSAGFYIQAGVYGMTVLIYYRLADKLTKGRQKMLAVPVLMFAAVLLGGLALSFWREPTLYGMMQVTFNAVMALILTGIFLRAIPVIASYAPPGGACDRGIHRQADREIIICGGVLLAGAIAGIGGAFLGQYSLQNIVSGIAVLTAALLQGAAAGAAVGVLAGMAAGLSSGQAVYVITLYALAGLMGGVFGRFGKAAVTIGSLLGGIIAVLYFGQGEKTGVMLTELSLAGGIFLATPMSKLTPWRQYWFGTSPGEDRSDWRGGVFNQLNDRLAGMADVFNELARLFTPETGEENNLPPGGKQKENGVPMLLDAIGEKTCRLCEKRSECWDKQFYRTYRLILNVVAQVDAGASAANMKIDQVSQMCIRSRELLDNIIVAAEQNNIDKRKRLQTAGLRRMAAEQMKACGAILGNLAQEINSGSMPAEADREIGRELANKAAMLDCPLSQVQIRGKGASLYIEAFKEPCAGTKECVNTLLPLAASLTQEKIVLHSRCGDLSRGKSCRLTMDAIQSFYVETGMASAPKQSGGECGDLCAVQHLGQGKTALFLSDGMGSGRQAAQESGAAVKSLKKLLKAGFGVAAAVKTVNLLLLMQTAGESFAAIDAVIVDSYSGIAEFLKVGSAPSFIKRVGQVRMVPASTPPAGVLPQLDLETDSRRLAPGDIIVMVSDGIIDAGGPEKDNNSWVVNFLRRLPAGQPQEMAERILQEALRRAGGQQRDDMAVLAARLTGEEAGRKGQSASITV